MTDTTSDMLAVFAGDGGHGGGAAVATAKEYPDEIRSLGDTLAGLNFVQAHLLRGYLKREYGIEAPENVDVETTHAPTGVTVEPPPPPEPTTFDVVLAGVTEPGKKIAVIKVIRELTGLGLAESKAFVESAPKTVKEAQEKAEAEKMKAALEAAGAKVELK